MFVFKTRRNYYRRFQGLFSTAFIAECGLDSFLFSVLIGSNPPDSPHT